MKHRFTQMCLAMLLAGLAVGAKADLQQNEDGFYLINDAADLVAFSELVNSGEFGVNAMLTADIDMSSVENFTPIGLFGNDSEKFYGIFDGQGHKISHLTINHPDKQAVGFINTGRDNTHVVVKNFWLDETCTIVGNSQVGMIGNHNHGEATFENLGNAGKVTGTGHTSGILGRAWSQSGNTIDMIACWSISEVTSTEGGGMLCGWASGSSTYRLTDCWTAGILEAPTNGFVVRGSATTIFNNVWATNGEQSGVRNFLAEDLASGGLCYYMNGDQSQFVWYQTLGQDPYPVTDSSHGIVYLTEGIGCNGRAKGDVPFSNTDLGVSAVPDAHVIEDGLCSVCGQLPQAEDGVYEISSAAALVKFSEMVNSGLPRINGRLTADIDMMGINFVPIGLFGDNSPNQINYYGTFDGGKHVISNLSIETDEMYEAGLFSRAYRATVKDLGVLNATIVSNNGSGRIGVIAGFNRESNFINCWSAGDLQLTCTDEAVETPQIGGIAGNSNNTCLYTNCWSTYEGVLGTGGGTFTNCYGYDTNPDIVAEAQSGALCYRLNGESFINVEWFQNLGIDSYPSQNSEKGIVYKTTSGYESFIPQDESSFSAFRTNMISTEETYVDEAFAYSALLDEYEEKVHGWESIATFEDFCTAYNSLQDLKQAIKASEAAYKQYVDACEYAINFLAENDFKSKMRTFFETYLNESEGPSEDYTNGTYKYILNTLQLDDEGIAAETIYVNELLQRTIATNILPGVEVTVTMTNYDFKDGLNGWTVETSNDGVTTGGNAEIMPLARGLNTNFSVEQTLSDVPNGIYVFSVNGFTRTADDIYSQLYSGQLYLNGNSNFLMSLGEDAISKEDAQDGVNCYLTGDNADVEYIDEKMEGYVPASLTGCSYAYSGGRYVNYTAVVVTDNTLTVGVRNMGSGLKNDWLPFGNVRVFYLGEDPEWALDELTDVLKSYQQRGETILNFLWSDSDEYAKYPNFSEALKDELENLLSESDDSELTGEQELDLINRFSVLFNEIYACRKAYVAMASAAEELSDKATTLMKLIDPVIYQETLLAAADAWRGYQEGSMSREEALAMVEKLDEIRANLGILPKDEEGFYLISNATDMSIFSIMVNNGDTGVNGRMTQDIDMNEVMDFDGIGVARDILYTGTFDGQGHKISGLTIEKPTTEEVGMFHIGDGAVLKNFWLDETCTITGSKNVGLVGWCNAANGATFEKVGNAAKMIGGENTSAFIGRGWSSTAPMSFTDCWTISEIDNTTNVTGNWIGWCSNWKASFTNCWTTSTFAIAPADVNYLTRKGDNVTFTNCYTLAGKQGTLMTPDDVTSGALCYMLNGDQSNITWYQTLGVDPYPVLDNTHEIVVKNEDGTYGNTTGIEMLATDERRKNADVYDLLGRRIAREKLSKGIYIENRKKILKK